MPHSLSMNAATDISRRKKHVYLQDTLSGNYTQGGDVIDLSNIANPGFRPGVPLGKVPDLNDCFVNTVPGGYSAQIVANANAPATPTLANAYALKVFSGPGTELAAGAYPTALTSSPLSYELVASPWGF